ncbi:C-type lectin domain family 18 member A-like isoform X2 [Centruroides sculpturatus]|uniref:C-type lectin domain family 18 member A-like isoform X2 n=1 Tax=Centruroides sculpturatus TaxID=218467 RepID=UPI000C6E6D34|nr:C-type lectin domain family 18 member A-like isoform X2 [Centruroides sculpturatus]
MTMAYYWLTLLFGGIYFALYHLMYNKWNSNKENRHASSFKLSSSNVNVFNDTIIKQIIDMHNFIRSQVQPPAADMEYMEWDFELAQRAHENAKNCFWNISTKGINFYRGNIINLLYPFQIWYEEIFFYDGMNNKCEENATCDNYTQMIMSKTNKIGCGINFNCWNNDSLFICHYHSKRTNVSPPYLIGRGCSLCNLDNRSKVLCIANLCTLCEDLQVDCKTEKCLDEASKYLCRKTCGFCRGIGNTNNDSKICCNGKLCHPGYVYKSAIDCQCEVLCPGPNCLKHTKNVELPLVTINYRSYLSQEENVFENTTKNKIEEGNWLEDSNGLENQTNLINFTNFQSNLNTTATNNSWLSSTFASSNTERNYETNSVTNFYQSENSESISTNLLNITNSSNFPLLEIDKTNKTIYIYKIENLASTENIEIEFLLICSLSILSSKFI